MKPQLFRGLQGRLVVLCLVLMAVSLATLTTLFYGATEDILSAAIRAHLQSIAQNRTDVISRWMKEREHDVEVLAKSRTVESLTTRLIGLRSGASEASGRQELLAFLRLVRDQYGAYHEITAIDREGRIVACTTGDPVQQPAPANSALLLSIRRGRLYVSGIKRHDRTQGLSVDIAAPIRSAAGRIVGAIVAAVDLGAVNEMTDAMRLMESGEAYLVDQRGVFITHRDRRRVFRDDISAVVGVSEVIGGRNGVGEYTDYRGIPVLGAFQWLAGWQWGLLAEVDRSEAFAPVMAIRRNLFLIAGLVTVAAVLATLLVARRIVNPLQELTGAVQAIASGRMDQRLAVAGHDEVSYLSQCFNDMAASLEHSRAETDERIREVTDRFKSKTEELEAANAALAQANDELQAANIELDRQRVLVARSARLTTMGEMAAGIAHEINNPLTTIMNLAHSLQAGLPQDDARRTDVAVIAEEVDKINKLVVSFLAYARPTKAKITTVEAEELVERALEMVRPHIRQKSLLVTHQIEPHIGKILADKEQIGQVLINLLLNAIQASDANAELRVLVRTAFSSAEQTANRVEIVVADQGAGIGEDDRERVFDPFFTTKSKGSGLGLSISQRIVEEHGGEIIFRSAAGQGTTFVVSLRAAEGLSHDTDPDCG